MRAYEIINEAFIGSIFLPNVELSVNTHAYDQADKRRITYELIDQVAKKADSVASELSKIGPNEEVYVYDPETRVSLGLRREAANKMKFQFNTVLGNRPHSNGRTKIIDIPSNAPEVKAMNSFVNIGRNTVRKIAPEPAEPKATKVEPSVTKPVEPVPKLPAIEPGPIKKAATAAVRNIPKFIKYIK
jgi:hypothetical protein